MAKASPIITAFNSGEFSPLFIGRTDVKYYTQGCRRMRNFIPAVLGPARRRPGTRFVEEVADSNDRTWLWKFEFNIEQAYVLEFGDGYVRFYANHGVVEDPGVPGTPLEVATPYAVADLTTTEGTFALRFVQSGDVLYIVHPDYPPQKLTRTAADAFNIAEYQPRGGPFQDLDPDNTITVYSSHTTGNNRTLTASSAIFLSTHVGALFYLEQKDIDSVEQWEAGKAVIIGDVRRSDGKNYTALNAATTGTVRPTHSRGAKYDGDGGVQWQFDDPGYGWCRIDAIGGGGTTATVDVLSRIPDNAVLVANASTRWAFGEWSEAEGYPDKVTFYRERLCFSRDRLIWQSVAGDFEDFRDRDDGGLVTAAMAITSDITSDRANRIEFLAPSDLALMVGTAGDETAISEISTTEPFGPGNVRARKQSEYGSRNIPVARAGDGIVFAQKAGRKIRDLLYSWEKEGWKARDLTVLAEHVTKGGVVDMAYQQEPDNNLWCVRIDGALLGLTINRDQDVTGWHPQRIGGYSDQYSMRFAAVESVISIPAPDGDRDEVWMVVRRYVNGASKRYVEWMEYHHEEGDDPDLAFYVDSGLSLINTRAATLTPGTGATVKGQTGVEFTAGSAVFSGADVGRDIHYSYPLYLVTGKIRWVRSVARVTAVDGTNTIATATVRVPWPNLGVIASGDWRMTATVLTGLDHLEGQTVQVRGDSATYPDHVVSGGSITLVEPASVVHVGLSCPAVLQPMPIDAGAADGTSQGKTSRSSRVGIGFHESAGCRYGFEEDSAELDRIELRGGGDDMDSAPALFTGVKTVAWPKGYVDMQLITILQELPHPCTITHIMPQVTVQDSR